MRALLFDLYGVIMFPQSNTALTDIEEAVGASGEQFWTAYWEERHNYDAGLVDTSEYWHRVGERIGQPIANLDAAIVADRMGWMRPNNVMVEYIKNLSAAGHLMGLLSNIPHELAATILEKQPWLKLFKPMILSCKTGLAKPQPEIFELALDRMNAKAPDVLFVDDMQKNVAAARSCGLAGHVFTDLASLAPVVDAHLAGTSSAANS